MKTYLLVNFGGPRDLDEVEPFLKELLCDPDVVRTWLPKPIHNWFFRKVAKKRAVKVAHDYAKIGNGSPIYRDTEALRSALAERLNAQIITFHRYLSATHEKSLNDIEQCESENICTLPLFPQFSYATTGSVARFFSNHLKSRHKLRWIKSYAEHPAFISAWQNKIAKFLKEHCLAHQDVYLLFSAHGLPRTFIEEGDPYEEECNLSFSLIMKGFPNILGRIAYQSKFGKGEWLRPYTDEICDAVLSWAGKRKQIVFIPLTFTSDHIETLFEIEELYLPKIRKCGLHAYRCPALNLDSYWIDALVSIAEEKALLPNERLIRT